jgi:hypothetical protein
MNNCAVETFKIHPFGQDKAMLKHVLNKIRHGQQMVDVEDETG